MTDLTKKAQGTRNHEKRLTKFQEYFYTNLLWWGFLVLLSIVGFFACGSLWDDVYQAVLEFIFVILGGGFLLVSALDYLYEEYGAPQSPEGKK